MKTVVLTFLFLSFTASAMGQNLAITHATVYSSPEATARKDVTVVIRDGVIAHVDEHVPAPRGLETIACQDCVVLAGFWNSHVHFMEPKWNDAAHQSAEKLTANLSDMLTHSGFTTAVDTGSDGSNTLALRQRISSGEVSGPRILTAGIPIFPAHALPYYVADLPPDFKAKLGQPETPQAAIAIVDTNHAAGTDLVKLFTGSIVAPNRITPMNVDIARAAADEAHHFGQLVFSHSTNLEGTRVAVAAGVDVLAHSPEVTDGIDRAFLQRMIKQRMTIIPTLKLFSHDAGIAQIRALDLEFHRLGGQLVYGTDTGFLPDYEQGEEFRQLALAGFSFRDVLAMLTTAPAELFHRSQHEGKVAPGMQGDITILSTDPAEGDPLAFTAVKYTIRGGKIIWRPLR